MKKTFIIILFLCLFVRNSYGIEIFSIRPYEIYPGTELIILGKDFSPNLNISIGNRELKIKSINNNRISLTIPNDIEPGIYPIRIKDDKRDIFYPFMLSIRKIDFSVKKFNPESIDRCFNGNIHIKIDGENLNLVKKVSSPEIGTLDFNASKNNISFTVSNDKLNFFTSSLNIYLYDETEKIREIIPIRVNSKPVIESISVLERDVTSLTLKILGKNFISPIKLFANGIPIIERDSETRRFHVSRGSPQLERFEVINCSEILYKIHPTTWDTQNLLIYFENTRGEKSNSYSITIP